MSSPRLTLVVNTYNAPDSLEKVFRAIALQTVLPLEVVVADDGSGPETSAVLDKWRGRLACPVLHAWQKNEGFRRTRVLNLAIAQTGGDYLVFLDGDCPPHASFVADHLMLAEPGHWVQARRCFVKEPYVHEFSPGETSVALWVALGRIEQGLKAFRMPWKTIRRDQELRGIIGCNLGIWREDLVAVNGYDESFTGWGREDSDLGARLYHLGRVRKFVRGRAVVFHLNHPVASRAQLETNQHRLEETLQTRRVRALLGLDQHLVSRTSA